VFQNNHFCPQTRTMPDPLALHIFISFDQKDAASTNSFFGAKTACPPKNFARKPKPFWKKPTSSSPSFP
jgi:hypothetical protein